MKNFVNLVCVVIITGAFFYDKVEPYLPEFDFGSNGGTASVVVVKPLNLYGFDAGIPAVLKDKEAARSLTGLFTGMADEIEHDGLRTKPEIRYAAHVRDALREAVNLKFDGKKLNDVATGLGDKIGPEFEKALPDGSAELTVETRKQSVELFRAAAYGCSLVK